MTSLAALNEMPADAFVATLAGVFEHSPWVPERAAARRPFTSLGALHAAMCDVVASAGEDEQLRLIRAHPQLAGRAAMRGELTESSRSEQSGAGLDQCSAEEYTQLHALNASYEQRFGFPFILAVRGHTRSSILANMASRLDHTLEQELAEALRQIERIAALRLGDMIR